MNFIFSNPYFLSLLPIAAAPIILHLISRGKPLKLFFPSIRFIKLGKVPSHEKRTLTDILLLIIRVLLLLALVFYFADPKLKKEIQNTENNKCVIIFDSSISSYHKNYYVDLISKIESELNQRPKQNSYLAINSAHQIIHSVKTDNARAAIQFIKNIKPLNTSPNHRQALQEASNFIGHEKATLIIAGLFDISGYEQISKITFHNETEIVCLKADIGENNINIIGAHFGKNINDNNLTRLSAKIVNEGKVDFNGEIKINVNNKIETKAINLKPSQIGTVVFNSEIPPATTILLSTSEDDYSPDNQYYCRSPQQPVVEFLLIKPTKSQSNESIFLEEALKVSETNMTKVNFNSVYNENFEPKEMKQPSFIMLSGCAELLTSEQLHIVREWHKLGTHLIITPSDEFRKSFSTLLSSGIITQSAVSKFGSANNSIPVFFNNLNEKSPYTSLFLKDGINDFISIPIHQYIKISHLKNTEILLTTENDDPILVINRLGSGICFLFTIALDPTWSDLPLTTTFLPLVRQIINITFQTNSKKLEEYVGPSTFIKTTKEDETFLYNNEQIMIPEKERKQFKELLQPGVYQFYSQAYIVNNSRKHSKPDYISAFEIKNTLLNQSGSTTKAEENSSDQNSIRNYLLILIFLFIFLEILFHGESFKTKKEVII